MIMGRRLVWRRPTRLTRTMRGRLDRLSELARHHVKPSGPAAVLGISVGTLKQTLYDLTGSSVWPPHFDAWLFDLPVEAEDDEAETAATVRTKFRHWLRATDTEVACAASGMNTTVGVLTRFLDGGPLSEPMLRRVLNRMRSAAWGYQRLGCGKTRRRSMPVDAAQSGPSVGDRPLKNPDDLAARIEADQARRRAEQEHWLDLEQQKYGLPRRGRLPQDMAA